MLKRSLILILVMLFFIYSCTPKKKHPHYEYQPEQEVVQVKKLKINILRTIPHMGKKRYTQGFEVYNGFLYESTGEYHFSSIKKLDIKTGKILMSHDIDDYFAEGLTILNGNMTLLSYKEGKAHTFNPTDFKEKNPTFSYNTQGWGLTNNGKQLIMSDGSDKIYYCNPNTFNVEKTINVTYKGEPLEYINELEYVNGKIYANIYGVPKIVVIDPGTGAVEAEADASNLDCSILQKSDPEAVLNGIAYNPATHTFYITGKRCSHIYEVTFE